MHGLIYATWINELISMSVRMESSIGFTIPFLFVQRLIDFEILHLTILIMFLCNTGGRAVRALIMDVISWLLSSSSPLKTSWIQWLCKFPTFFHAYPLISSPHYLIPD